MKQILLALFFISSLFGLDSSSKAEDYTAFESNLESHKSKCEAGDGKICKDIAVFYSHKFSQSNFKDIESEKLKLEYNLKSCNTRDGMGCLGVALAYTKSAGYTKSTPEDPAKELEYLIKGCDYNESVSCYLLGSYYNKESKTKSGADKKATELKAKRFYKKACDLGYKLGCDM